MLDYKKRVIPVLIFMTLALSTLPFLQAHSAMITGSVGLSSSLTDPFPTDLNYNFLPYKLVPVQAAWDPNINSGPIDLVLGKSTAIIVNAPEAKEVTIEFLGITHPASSNSDGIFSFYEIIPSQVTPVGDFHWITGKYINFDGDEIPLNPVAVSVKATSDMSLSYYYLYRKKISDYGIISEEDFYDTVGHSRDFLYATYPIANLMTHESLKGIKGANIGNTNDPYRGLRNDAIAAAQDAQQKMGGGAIGIAIGPNNPGADDYFTYHGFPGAAGVSFGPAVKGVVVLEGFYTGVAHEVAHTFDVYWGEPEQYDLYPQTGGLPASGVDVVGEKWRTGICFMGLTNSLDQSWIHTYTYEELFKKLRLAPEDPEILLANGVIYQNGTVDYPLPWYRLAEGTPDTLTPGNFSLKFLDENDQPLAETSFDATFYVNIEPASGTIRYPCGFGRVETDAAPFAFTTVYPPGTSKIQLLSKSKPLDPLSVVNASSIRTVIANAGGPYTADEGSPITFNASGSYDVYGRTLQYMWDFEGDGVWDTRWTANPVASHTWYDDWVGHAIVNATDGVSYDTDTASVIISNVIPKVHAGPDLEVTVRKQFSFGGSFEDPGTDDNHTVEWDLGDGSIALNTLNPAHAYTERGEHVVTLSVTDDDGGIGEDMLNVKIIAPIPPWVVALFYILLAAILTILWQSTRRISDRKSTLEN